MRRIHIRILLALVLATLTRMPLHSDSLKNIAVLNFSCYNTSERIANVLRNKIEFRIFESEKFSMLERNRLDILEREIKLSGEKEGTTGYALAVGKLLMADYIVTGSVSFDGRYHVNITLVSSYSGAILFTIEETFTDENSIYENADRFSSDIISAILSDRITGADTTIVYEKSNWNLGVTAGIVPGILRLNPLLYKGININIGLARNLFFDNFYAGLNAGYFHFYIDEQNAYSIIGQVQFNASLVFLPGGNFSVCPSFSAGASYVYLTNPEESHDAIEPSASFIASIGYRLSQSSSLLLSLTYNSLFEEDGMVDFFSVATGINISL